MLHDATSVSCSSSLQTAALFARLAAWVCLLLVHAVARTSTQVQSQRPQARTMGSSGGEVRLSRTRQSRC